MTLFTTGEPRDSIGHDVGKPTPAQYTNFSVYGMREANENDAENQRRSERRLPYSACHQTRNRKSMPSFATPADAILSAGEAGDTTDHDVVKQSSVVMPNVTTSTIKCKLNQKKPPYAMGQISDKPTPIVTTHI